MSSKSQVKNQGAEAYLEEVGRIAGEAFEPVDELITLNKYMLRGGCQLCKYQKETSYRADFLRKPSLHYSKHFAVSNFQNL